MEDSENKIQNKSGDHDYFVITPEIVLAGTDPFETRFWIVVKMIAAETGECFAGIRLLAQLSKMSVGKANQCRHNLVRKGLLLGGPDDPSDPNSRWTLTVPDLWKKNIEWRESTGKLLRQRANAYTNFCEKPLLRPERKRRERRNLPF